jgi:hypothetical protein
MALSLRFEVEPECTAVVVPIADGVAVCQVMVRSVPVGGTGKDALSMHFVSERAENAARKQKYV